MQPDLPSLEMYSRGPLRVRLCFVWSGDRYAQRLVVTDDGQEQFCFESLEGAPGEAWPPSPALQQLSFQPGVSGGQCALLVGMAGKSHWSLSVETNESSLVFDVACRVQESPERLRSTYRGCEKIGTGTFATTDFPRVSGFSLGASPIFSQPHRVARAGTLGDALGAGVSPSSFTVAAEQGLVCDPSPSAATMKFERLTLVVEAEANDGVVVRDDREGRLAILPAGRIGDLPATVRWRYRLRLIPPDGPSFAGSEP
jgi:hypothetical protein